MKEQTNNDMQYQDSNTRKEGAKDKPIKMVNKNNSENTVGKKSETPQSIKEGGTTSSSPVIYLEDEGQIGYCR